MQTINVAEEYVGERLDKFLSEVLEDTSRSDIQTRIKSGNVQVNANTVKPNYKLKVDDVIEISEREVVDSDIVPEDLNLNILYEDSDVAVVEKPRGMVVHPSAGHHTGTLVNGLMHQLDSLSGINGELRPGIVHRIDKDTSGLLMVAKHDVAHRDLVDQLVEKSVTRKYIALVHGVITHDKGTVDAPIGRNPKSRQDMAVVDDGKEAVTHFNVLERFEDYTLIECFLETGRTHQIRVHMDYIGHPLVGDPKYTKNNWLNIEGQALFAKKIGFIHPGKNKWMEFEVDLPPYLKDLLMKIDN